MKEEKEEAGESCRESFSRGGDRNTHFLGTVLETLGEGGVGGRTGLGAGAEMDRAVSELPVHDAHVAVRLAAVVGHGYREAVGGHLRLDGLVWHSGNGNRDSSV